ncbi:MAG: hypothetical protein COZ27_03875, partial [Candidatus Moranbacteria bacterium CG_4_10_14_3_um_filter_41_65]
GLVELATPTAIKEAEKAIARRKKDIETLALFAKKTADELAGKKVTITSKAEKGKLFGSIGSEEIALALKEAGIVVDAKNIIVEKPFKEIGAFAIEAHFGHGVKASFEVLIKAE